MAEVAATHDLLHVDRLHREAFRVVNLLYFALSAHSRALHHNEKAMVLEEVNVSARHVLVIIDLFVKHLAQVLVRLLVFVLDKPL